MTSPFGANPGDNASIDEAAPAIPGMYSARQWMIASTCAEELVRAILEAVCIRDGISLDSDVDPGKPARNYELALRLGIGRVFGIGDGRDEADERADVPVSPVPG